MKRIAQLSLLAFLAAGCGDVTGSVRAPEAPRSVLTALHVFIGGPARINSSVTCTWEASASGGTAPYSYSWSTVGGGGTGVDETWYGGFPVSGSLSVTVTDALGATASATRNVTSVYNGPLCP